MLHALAGVSERLTEYWCVLLALDLTKAPWMS